MSLRWPAILLILCAILVLVLGAEVALAAPLQQEDGPPVPPTMTPAGLVAVAQSDDGQEVTAQAGSILVLSLRANPSTGFMWDLGTLNPRFFRLIDRHIEAHSELLGAPVTETIRLRILEEGDTSLRVDYRRPWVKDDSAFEPMRSFALRLTVQGRLDAPAVAEPYPEEINTSETAPIHAPRAATSLDLSSAFDWRELGGLTPVKNQGACGSCWAFATAGVTEALLKIQKGLVTDVSEQYLLGHNEDGWDCDGGWFAFKYHVYKTPAGEREAGAVLESACPYVSAVQACPDSQPLRHPHILDAWNYRTDSVEGVKAMIYRYGPVVTTVCVGQEFTDYEGGVFETDESAECNGGVNHAVVLVGWDDSQGAGGTWILRNSWGSGWGEDGYMRIGYGVSNAGKFASYATYDGTPWDFYDQDVYPLASHAYDIEVHAGYAYVAVGADGVQIYDVTTPASPSAVGLYTTPGSAQSLAVADDYLYVADSTQINVLDLSNPSAPSALGAVSLDDNGWQDLTIQGSYAYVADAVVGLRILDIADPTSPMLVSDLALPGKAKEVAVSGYYAYVATAPVKTDSTYIDGGLVVVDITDPAAPTQVAFYDTPGMVHDLAVADSHAYVAEGALVSGDVKSPDGLHIIDISNPLVPSELTFLPTYGDAYGLTVADGIAYLGRLELTAFSVADPANPTLYGMRHLPSSIFSKIEVFGDHAWLSTYGGIYGLRLYHDYVNGYIPSTGGSLSAKSGEISFSFPQDTFDEEAVITYRRFWEPPDVDNFTPLGPPFSLEALAHNDSAALSPNQPYTVEIIYDPEQVDTFLPILYAWDGTVWVTEPSSQIDVEAHRLTATPDYMGRFTLGSAENYPPNSPTNPSPIAGATDESVILTLGWRGGDPDGDNITYDVYLEAEDATPDALICKDVHDAACNPGVLQYNTTYHWYVVAHDAYNATTTGPVWTFTTLADVPDMHYVALGGDCGGAEPCYASVQDALSAAVAGNEIRVAAGTYSDIFQYASLAQVAYIEKSVTLRGGYAINNWEISDPDANLTTLDAQGQGRGMYIIGNCAPTVEGFRITGGDANGLGGSPAGRDSGGGIYVYRAAPTLRHNHIVGNHANQGAGLYLAESAATLIDNSITMNTSTGYDSYCYGGGLHLRSSQALLVENDITDNAVCWYGGGLYLVNSPAWLYNNAISGNQARHGAGLYILGGATLLDNIIAENRASLDGGGVGISGDGALLQGNVIQNNSAAARGGGAIQGYGTAMWLNTVFASNFAERGNGLYVGLATAHLTHTTMARNGTEGTGLYVSDNGVAALTNAVLAEHAVGIETLTNSVVTLDGALWYGNGTDVAALAPVAITNNYVGDPAFSSDGYHLNAGSAAIDRGAGSNLIFDLDGDPRPLGGAPDLGADEFADHAPLTLALSLVPGWNLISLPLHPEDPSIEAVLRSLEGRYKHVQVFENCADGNPWRQFDPHATANTLSTLDETKGIWINMAVTGTLVLTGTVPTFSYVPLCAGINLMGYPLDQAQPTAAALNTIAGHYTLVFAYDATTQSWRKFDVNAPDFVNTLAALEPGRGYWVVASEGTTWYAKR